MPSHTHTPLFPCPGVEENERGEKVKVRRLQAWWRNIHVSLFSLVFLMKDGCDYKAEDREELSELHSQLGWK